MLISYEITSIAIRFWNNIIYISFSELDISPYFKKKIHGNRCLLLTYDVCIIKCQRMIMMIQRALYNLLLLSFLVKHAFKPNLIYISNCYCPKTPGALPDFLELKYLKCLF